jgi:short-subunit dehydrogenase
MACYGSSKRYIRSFAASLRHELGPWGVNVTCLAPGAVATGLSGMDGSAARKAARLRLVKDPESVARLAVRGMLRRKALVLPGLSAKAMALGMTLTPRWLIYLLRTHTSYLPKPRRLLKNEAPPSRAR